MKCDTGPRIYQSLMGVHIVLALAPQSYSSYIYIQQSSLDYILAEHCLMQFFNFPPMLGIFVEHNGIVYVTEMRALHVGSLPVLKTARQMHPPQILPIDLS